MYGSIPLMIRTDFLREEGSNMRCDDSDMKIMPERVSKVFDSAGGAAVAFAREKANGNMDKARALGLRFAQELICKEGGLTSFGVGAFDDARTVTQRKILFSYVVNQVIADLFPNSIVAQSAMSSFYNKIEQESPETSEMLFDSVAFTMYILTARSSPSDPKAIGEVFARLCQREDDPLFVRYGMELAEYFTLRCTQTVLEAGLIR